MAQRDWPEPPDLGAREVHLWWARVDCDVSSDSASRCISDAERRRAARFVQERDRRRYAARQTFLRRVLGRYLDADPRTLVFREGEHGKPYLEGERGQGLRFNLSHSDERILIGVACGREVGVDVEAVRPRDELDGMASLTFSSLERAAYASAAETARLPAFFRVWTRKEAALKALGDGFSREPRTLHVGLADRSPHEVWTPEGEPVLAAWGLADLIPPGGFAAAVCAAGNEWAPVPVAGWELALAV